MKGAFGAVLFIVIPHQAGMGLAATAVVSAVSGWFVLFPLRKLQG